MAVSNGQFVGWTPGTQCYGFAQIQTLPRIALMTLIYTDQKIHRSI